MRVLVVTTWFPSAGNPTEAPFNLNHAEAIALGHDVRVIHVRLGSNAPTLIENYGGFRVQRLSFNPLRPWRGLRVLRDVRRAASKAQIVHTMAFSSVLIACPALIWLKQPWVHTEHWNGVPNPASVSRLWERFAWLRRALGRPDWLTGVTTQLSKTLALFGRVESTSTIPCVVENPLGVNSRPLGSPLRLVAVGGLIERKQPVLAVQTVAYLKAQGMDVVMTWVGDGPQRQLVEKEIARHGLADRFILVGAVEPGDVFDYFQESDVFFLPTTQENFFTSAAEALSAGRPVVATRVGGFEDYANPSNSILVDEATAQDFADAILEACALVSPTSAIEMAEPIRDRFSRERVGASFSAIYRELTERP